MSSEQGETRTRILTATLQLMEEQSGQEVRMQDIAKAAGISRQAVYLHFKSRAELLIAAIYYGDEIRDVTERIRRWEDATTGVGRLEEWVEMWGNYIPEIYGLAKALLAVREADEAANLAWKNRMTAVRIKCADTVEWLERDGMLAPGLRRDEAVDLFSTILSVRSWEHLTQECGWSKGQYVRLMKQVLRRMLVRDDTPSQPTPGESAPGESA